MRRDLWLWLLALLAGFGLGLFYAWTLAPVRYINTLPNTLRSDFKDQFRIAVSSSYAANHNLDRARARLAYLGDTDPVQALSAQAQRMLASGMSFDAVQQVANLAADLQSGVVNVGPTTITTAAAAINPTSATYSPSPSPTVTLTSEIPSVTATLANTAEPLDTPTPRPTHTPVPTPGIPYQLASQESICNPDLTYGLMQITVLDSRHHQMPGVEIIITWSSGQEHIFTGLKPEIANGYADFVMQAGITYSVQIANSGTPVPGVSAPSCPDSNGQSYLGGIHLTFQQP